VAWRWHLEELAGAMRLPWGFLVENPLHIDAEMRAASAEWPVKKPVTIGIHPAC
jgi:hypothetical protein